MIDLVNLAPEIEEESLQKIARMAYEDYQSDDDDRQEWVQQHAKWIKLYYQSDTPDAPPWEHASEESMPLMAEACNQFQARAYQAIFPNENIIKCIPVGMVDDQSVQRAERISRHMNWQLMVRDLRYRRDKDALLLSVPIHGCMFTKTYYDPMLKRPLVRNVRAEDLILPYGIGPRTIEDVDRSTEIIYKTLTQCEMLVATGFFSEMPQVYLGGDKSETTQAIDEIQGVHEPTSAKNGPVKLLEQHRYLDLNSDGLNEPYIVTLCAQTKKIVRLAPRYEDNDGQMVPINYYTQYDFLRNPDGIYGLGMGHLIGKINAAVNKLLRQTIDAGELANVGNMSGFVSEVIGLEGEEIQFRLGEFQRVRPTSGTIREGIYQFNFPGPNPALPNIMQTLMARSDRLATVSEALTGQTSAVMQPTALLALIEQGLSVFSTVYARILLSMQEELQKIYRLNRLYLPQEEYFAVQDLSGTPQMTNVTQEDYAEDFQVSPIADPKMATEQQKMARAEAELNYARSSPLVSSNPEALYNAEKRYLTAIGTRNIDEILKPPQPPEPPPPPPRVDDQNVENVGFLLPTPHDSTVFMDQDHIDHIKKLDAMLQDPVYGAHLTPEGKKMAEAHRQTHLAFLYAATETDMLETMHDGQAGQGGMDPMASPPGNPIPPQDPGAGALPDLGSLEPGGGPGTLPSAGQGPAAQFSV